MKRILLAAIVAMAWCTIHIAQESPAKSTPVPTDQMPILVPPTGPTPPSDPRHESRAIAAPPVLNTPSGTNVTPPPWQSAAGTTPKREPAMVKPQFDDGPSARVDSTNAPASAQHSQVSVEVLAPETANVGAPVTQEIVVRNHGRAAVYHVRVEQEVSAGVKYIGSEPKADAPGERLAWNLGILDGGAERRIKVQLQSSDEGLLRSRAIATFSTTCGSVTKLTRPRLTVSINGPDSVLVGEQAVFQIRLSNSGTGPIQKLLLRDRLPAGLQHPQGNVLEAEVAGLAPGESRTVTLRTTATQVGNFVHEIQAFADGLAVNNIQLAGGPRNPDLESTAKAEIRIVEPGLQIRLTGPKTCLIKCDGVLSIDLTNPGSAPTRNIRLQAKLPDGMEFVALSEDGQFDPATRTASWSYASLEPGAHRVLMLKAKGVTLGDSACVAVAQAENGLTAKAELPMKIEGVPALSLEVVDLDDPAPVGSEATYEIRVLNQGTCPCTGISIVATMPDGMELREASAPSPYKVQGQQVQFGSFPRLATKADLVYRIKVKSRAAGDVRFRVQLTCDQLQQPVFKEESSRFYKQ